MRWPPCEFSKPPYLRDLVTDSQSPSKTDLWNLVSREKRIALFAASSSRISIVGGFLIFSDSVAITSPLGLRIITPIPASSHLLNIAPSKLIFAKSGLGGHHFLDGWHRMLGEHLVNFMKSRT